MYDDLGHASEDELWFTGSLDGGDDFDFFSVELEAGTTYSVGAYGADSGYGTLADPILGFYDDQFEMIAVLDDTYTNNHDLGVAPAMGEMNFASHDATGMITVYETGMFYFAVADEAGSAGNYSFALSAQSTGTSWDNLIA
jgi:hypothetical protein